MTGRHGTSPEFQHHQRAKPKSFDDFDLRLGDIMRGERATMGKSLLDVQRELKIKATYIAAIENADPSAFESPGFVAGYVRSYARYPAPRRSAIPSSSPPSPSCRKARRRSRASSPRPSGRSRSSWR